VGGRVVSRERRGRAVCVRVCAVCVTR